MNVDLELYRVFYEVVKYKNITKTAENMHISQSAITQSIQKLETLLGGKVFYRNKKGVELTEEGKNLYSFIKDSIETMNNAENLFSQNLNLENGLIRIGGGDVQIETIIIDPLCKFKEKYPNIKINISMGKTDELIQKLSNGEVDIVTTRKNPSEIKKYSNIEFVPLKKCIQCFEKEKIEPNNKNNYEVSTTTIVKKLALKNLGVGFTEINSLKDISDKVDIIKEIKIDDLYEGIVILNKKMCSKATLELVKYIEEYQQKN